MTFAKPEFSRSKVDKAGYILAAKDASQEDIEEATSILSNWRASHAYPLNVFQTNLRKKLRKTKSTITVAQRLKRKPSIISKLQRFNKMKLSRIQDIGGLRAILKSTKNVRDLEQSYLGAKFKHEISRHDDYISEPKQDGYRGVHIVYKYKKDESCPYENLQIELQIRTRLQHSWATAVETVDTYLGQGLKSGKGKEDWKNFFNLCGSALAIQEEASSLNNTETRSPQCIRRELLRVERKLKALDRFASFRLATENIEKEKNKGRNAYHIIVLDYQARKVSGKAYSRGEFDAATANYAFYEEKAKEGWPIDVVLVSAGSINSLKKAYPNYFLDTRVFLENIYRFLVEFS